MHKVKANWCVCGWLRRKKDRAPVPIAEEMTKLSWSALRFPLKRKPTTYISFLLFSNSSHSSRSHPSRFLPMGVEMLDSAFTIDPNTLSSTAFRCLR